MRSQNRKVNSIGRAGCLGLLALGLALINPVGSSVYAEEVEDYGIDTQVLLQSAVGISFSPAAGSTSLTPITSAGQSAQINVLATVDVANSGGYSVYLKSNSQNLVGVNNPSNVIPGIAGNVTYDNLSTNTWGYYAVEGEAVPENATYKAVSTGQGDKIAENTNSKIVADTKNIMLSFVAKIGDNVPADTYQSTVTMSVVSSPVQLALSDISEMQQMTSEICENTPVEPALGSTKQLKDVRDGKYYWVTKLADNHCWMTQNLDLDLSTETELTSAETDLGYSNGSYPVTEKKWAPDFNTVTEATKDTVNFSSQTETRSWNLGDYRIINPADSQSCGYSLKDVAACPGVNATSGLTTNRFAVYTTPTTANKDGDAHYIVGNHYQWNAATAGTGGSITEGQATDSICPRGWKLPTSDSTEAGSFGGLADAYKIGSDVAKLTSAPLYFVRGGYVHRETGTLFANAGDHGDYWSSTPSPDDTNAYILYFIYTNTVNPYGGWYRYTGFSVRCLAR